MMLLILTRLSKDHLAYKSTLKLIMIITIYGIGVREEFIFPGRVGAEASCQNIFSATSAAKINLEGGGGGGGIVS